MAGVVIGVGAGGWLSPLSAHASGEPTASITQATAAPETLPFSIGGTRGPRYGRAGYAAAGWGQFEAALCDGCGGIHR